MNIDELKGEALALAVARARGCVFVQESSSGEAGLNLWRLPNGELELEANLPRPDRDIAQAWELLDGYVYAIDTYEDRERFFGAPVACYLRNGDGSVVAYGDTAPEAICRAYLKAKGWSDEQEHYEQ